MMRFRENKPRLGTNQGISLMESLIGAAILGTVAVGLTSGQLSNMQLHRKISNISSRNLTDNTLPAVMFTAIHKAVVDQARKNLDSLKHLPETSDDYRICKFSYYQGFAESLQKTIADNSLNETIDIVGSESVSWMKTYHPSSKCANSNSSDVQFTDYTDKKSLSLCVRIKGMNANAEQWWDSDAGIQKDKKFTTQFYERNDVYMEVTYVFRDLRIASPISCKQYVKTDIPSAGTMLYTIYWWQKGKDKETTKPSFFNGEIFGRARLPLAVAVQKMFADFLDVKQGDDSTAITEKDLDKYLTALELGKSLKEVSQAIQREPVVLEKKAEQIAEKSNGSVALTTGSVLAMKQAWQHALSAGSCPGGTDANSVCQFTASDKKNFSSFIGSIYSIIGDFAAETHQDVTYNGYTYSWYYWNHLQDQADLKYFLPPSGTGVSTLPSPYFRDLFDDPSHPNYLYRPGITLREFAELRRQAFIKVVESASFAQFAVYNWKRKFDIKFNDQDSSWIKAIEKGASWEDIQAQMNGSLSYAIE